MTQKERDLVQLTILKLLCGNTVRKRSPDGNIENDTLVREPLGEDAKYYIEDAINQGFYLALDEFSRCPYGVNSPGEMDGIPEDVVMEATAILDMWKGLEGVYRDLSADERHQVDEVNQFVSEYRGRDSRYLFPGFNASDPVECIYLVVIDFKIEHSGYTGKYVNFAKDVADGNRNFDSLGLGGSLPEYRDMLVVFSRLRDERRGRFGVDELKLLLGQGWDLETGDTVNSA